jgi:hypothetical protein
MLDRVLASHDGCQRQARVTKVTCRAKATKWACSYSLSTGDSGITSIPGKPHPEITVIC